MIDEGLLQRVEHAVPGQPLDGGDLCALEPLRAWSGRTGPPSVDYHGARSADPDAAPVLRAGELEVGAQDPQQRALLVGVEGGRLPVQPKADGLLHRHPPVRHAQRETTTSAQQERGHADHDEDGGHRDDRPAQLRPRRGHHHPALDQRVGESGHHQRSHRGGEGRPPAAGEARHRERDGVHVGQPGQGGDHVVTLAGEAPLDSGHHEEDGREQEAELDGGGEAERVLEHDLAGRRWRLSPAAAQEDDGRPESDHGHRPEGQEERPHERREEDRGEDDDPHGHHRPGEEKPRGERVVGLPALLAALLGEGEGHRGRGDEAAGEPGHRRAAPRPEGAGRDVADERERGDQDDERPQRAGLERPPGVDGGGGQERQDDERRGEQLHPRGDVVRPELRHQAVHRLLVGEDGRDHDPDREGDLGVAHRTRPAEQAHSDRRRLGREPDRVRLHPGLHDVARHGERDHRRDRGHEDPRVPERLRQPGGDGADQGEEDEGADTADADVAGERFAPLALDPDEGADEERGGEAPDEVRVEGGGHRACLSAPAGGTPACRSRPSPRSGRAGRSRGRGGGRRWCPTLGGRRG